MIRVGGRGNLDEVRRLVEEGVEPVDTVVAKSTGWRDDGWTASLFTAYSLFLPHFRLYEVVLLHMCDLAYEYRNILEMLPKLMARRWTASHSQKFTPRPFFSKWRKRCWGQNTSPYAQGCDLS